MAYRIGIDAGSKTMKLVVLDEQGNLAFHLYRRHRSNIKRTLAGLLEDFVERYGNVEGAVAVTGSAGIAVAKMLGLPFVQEVVATTAAVRNRLPAADVVVELGGEDAKVVYLTGASEQRMNATCAGGTGGFIDTIAGMLGVRTAEIEQLARRSSREYPIASRCAVFAQTDVRPLLAAGVSKEDIAASALSAVVRQTLGGLACGRPLTGTVVFLGGPFEYVPELARRFRAELGLDEGSGLRPENAHLFTACGAALHAGLVQGDEEQWEGAAQLSVAGRPSANVMSLSDILQAVVASEFPEDGLHRKPALFDSADERRAFEERHAVERYPRCRLFNCEGPLYLGFDAGSTTVKYALVNARGELVYYGYLASEGNVLETALVMLKQMYKVVGLGDKMYLAQSVVVGYGDELLKQALRIDSDVVETTAHLAAARHLCPDVSFVLDIGGQDMKALWVKDGQVTDAILNEACSSGCGAFVEGTAKSLKMTRQEFSTAALEAAAPFDLGTKCTVFMTSRVRHAQKAGADRKDIAAGIAYSVVENALFRVIGRDKSAEMGDRVVVQGGAFKSDAVLRAFEKVSGVQAVRPDRAHLMGAIGAALIARDRAVDFERSLGDDAFVASSTLGPEELDRVMPRYATMACDGCANACALSVVDFGDGRSFASGNRCSAGQAIAGKRLAEQGIDALLQQGAALPRIRKHRRKRNRDEAGFNPLIGASFHDVQAGGAGARAVPGENVPGEGGAMVGVGLPLRQLAEVQPKDDGQPGSVDGPARTVRIVAPKHAPQFESGNSAMDHMARTMHVSLTNLYCFGRKSGGQGAGVGAAESPSDAHPASAGVSLAGAAASGLRAGKRPVYTHEGAAADRGRVPNVVKYEQELLASYVDAPATTRSGAVVGLPCVLAGFEQLPFWHELLRCLGFGVLVADGDCVRSAKGKAAESVPSESVCEPAKVAHARLFALREAGATAVLLPRYERGSRCPVMCGYADVLCGNVGFLRDGTVKVASPTIRPTDPQRIARDEACAHAVFESLRNLDPANPVDREEFDAALVRAAREHASFVARVRKAADGALAWMEADLRRSGIVVAGRPYHIDAALLHGIDDVVEHLGFAVIPALGVAQRAAALDAGEGRGDRSADDADWKPAKHLLRLARYVASQPALDLVALQSFGCGYDAITMGDVRDALTGAGRTFTALKIDEIVDTAHIRIRLRTMAEAIEARRRAERAEEAEGLAEAGKLQAAGRLQPAARTGAGERSTADVAQASLPPNGCASQGEGPDRAPVCSPDASRVLFEAGIGPDDLDVARSSVPADICFTAAACMARAISVQRECSSPAKLSIPRVCKGCMIDAVPRIVKRATGIAPVIIWEGPESDQLRPPCSSDRPHAPAKGGEPGAEACEGCSPRRAERERGVSEPRSGEFRSCSARSGERLARAASAPGSPPFAGACGRSDAEGDKAPRIGIVGNPLLCFDSYMNENLAGLLVDLGARPVWPDPAKIYVDDVRYLDQLDEFQRQGVDAVLYLQSFGCLKGHVQARGALLDLVQSYPHMSVTVLDFDPESSALNRENRIRLAVAAARRMADDEGRSRRPSKTSGTASPARSR